MMGQLATPNLATSINDQQYLTFLLNGEMYAFAILNVKEILEYGKVTPIPRMPKFIQGVINLRGEVVPVINLAHRFQIEARAITKRTCIVIIEVDTDDQRQDLGVLVDSVSEVIDIPMSDIRAAPAFSCQIRTDFIRAMAQLQDNFVIILAEDKVLSVDELAMVDKVAKELGKS
ncbi:purine-binding chemotaxis protein CheW [Vibrio metschnikovii]|jgi:purine-binding chemotaxis protein CheW|uniref:Purine-binding chemotaxis protein CheW n=7 Tax=Bacteria TaxID=2 RepID=A0A9X0R8U3_VIBME|nr:MULTISPECIES: chemotaxis protein CheW [Vibrio]EKO3556076.1 purine-binding chemotaxis protein CheW [Vibrio metschnikovii]EKO3564016.1 purine-binding chemotaxis protein CheW [Vibrio metschnikovii]EKO3567568.1 purine-binding chemotaxis protein CheW [Vibrio metschnikovii]EKO3571298.1 purine-binding chemotaxis protein CheW [Vibrio metschnikovii]EKO3574398.1 purine-binding chemotaxis protein CheW [Vibrio metschnikovii]